ncbi:hypothetical protein GDO86_018177 [Hymenochirus boettgeri]|uniref:Nucleolar protein 12 n=1 Tax=Hymenochirus boettgeri TaxID=247094 RepID=A0A8T2ID48_9PIPI|nr:hypothetical protein GDO86_018177 [Hymenochirus boettgeri]
MPHYWEEADELERLVTSKTESILYDHPNHTVTGTTISDLDLSGVGLLPGEKPEVNYEEEKKTDVDDAPSKSSVTLPKKAGDPLLSKRICSLTASLHSRSQRKSAKRPSRIKKKKQTEGKVTGRTSKTQRRRQTGRSKVGRMRC